MKLYDYQEYCVAHLKNNKCAGLFLEMGLGKTITTLTAIADMIALGEPLGKILIIAPLTVARHIWAQEAQKWKHTQHLTFSLILGTPKQRLDALHEDADIHIINRENTQWLEHYLAGRYKWPFDTVVIDELSSFKSPSSQRFKALRRQRKHIRRIIGLTGTPAPNGLLNLWSQMFLLDQGQRLEKTLTAYRNNYFLPDKRNGHIIYSYKLKENADTIITEKISDICISMKKVDHLDLPAKIHNTIDIHLDAQATKDYKKLKEELVLFFGGEFEDVIFASNAAVLAGKLLQFSGGAVYIAGQMYEKLHKVQQQFRVFHNFKLEATTQAVEEQQGNPIMVLYNYKHELARLKEALPDAYIFDSKTFDQGKWDKGEIPIMLAHPGQVGHGLNLQYGCNTLLWYSLPWSLELYEQACDRLHRPGQKHQIYMHYLIAKNTIDERVLEVLKTKGATQNNLTDALKRELKED